MKTIKISIRTKDIENYEEYFDNLADYPLYASTCGINRIDGVIVGKIMQYSFEDGEYDITITKKRKRTTHGTARKV